MRAQEDASAFDANRGVALLEQFRFSEAVDAFESFVALEPEDQPPGYINLGIAYFNERDFEKALETALSNEPVELDSRRAPMSTTTSATRPQAAQGDTETAAALVRAGR